MTELLGAIVTVLAIIGVLCNNRKMSVCFKIWLVSNSISAVIHWQAGIYTLVIRDLVFMLLAVEGMRKWK